MNGTRHPRTRGVLRQELVEPKAEDGRKEHGSALGGGLPAAVKRLAVGGVLDEEGRRGAELASGGEPLEKSRDQADQAGPRADRAGGGSKGHDARAQGHQQDRHGQRLLASRFVAVAAKHHGAKRTDHVGQRERPESQKQSRDAVPGREEKLADDQGE
jgi:hypothetical protein